MSRRTRKRRARRQEKRAVARALRRVREFFSAEPRVLPDDDQVDSAGGLGVREPRRPLHPSLSGPNALEAPPEELRDVWAVGSEGPD